jgi:hypothetical protein
VSLVEARDLFCVYPSADGGVAALQGLTLDVDRAGSASSVRAARARRHSPCAAG